MPQGPTSTCSLDRKLLPQRRSRQLKQFSLGQVWLLQSPYQLNIGPRSCIYIYIYTVYTYILTHIHVYIPACVYVHTCAYNILYFTIMCILSVCVCVSYPSIHLSKFSILAILVFRPPFGESPKAEAKMLKCGLGLAQSSQGWMEIT